MWHKAFKSVVIHCLYRPTRNNPETNKVVIQLKMPWIFWCDSLRWTYSYKFIYRAIPPNSKQMPVSRLRTGILQVSAQAPLWVTVVADPTLGQVCGYRWMSLPLSSFITKIFTTGILSSPAWGERHLRITESHFPLTADTFHHCFYLFLIWRTPTFYTLFLSIHPFPDKPRP